MTRRREIRLKKSRTHLAWMITAVIVVISVGAWWAWAASGVSPPLNDALCPTEQRIAGELIVILDATDEWSAVREIAVRREVGEIRDAAPRFSRITIHVVEPVHEPGRTAVLTLCNPGTLDQVGEDARRRGVRTPVVSNEDHVQAYQLRFATLLDSVVATQGAAAGRPTSPIMETVRQAVLTAPGAGPFDVFLISDMHQNSAVFSVYDRPDWSPSLADSLADVYVQGTQRLDGSRVTILLLSPPKMTPDVDRVRRFWTNFFERQGATLERIERIEG